MTKSKKIKLKKSDVGRFVRVFFDDTGASDGIITQVDKSDDFRYLPLDYPARHGDVHNNAAPAIALGKHVTAKDSGLG